VWLMFTDGCISKLHTCRYDDLTRVATSCYTVLRRKQGGIVKE
jgi:hypothetical protein